MPEFQMRDYVEFEFNNLEFFYDEVKDAINGALEEVAELKLIPDMHDTAPYAGIETARKPYIMRENVSYRSYKNSIGGAIHVPMPAWWHEHGTVRMEARPFMSVVLERNKDEIIRALENCMGNVDIKRK